MKSKWRFSVNKFCVGAGIACVISLVTGLLAYYYGNDDLSDNAILLYILFVLVFLLSVFVVLLRRANLSKYAYIFYRPFAIVGAIFVAFIFYWMVIPVIAVIS
ncbi:hypothetical protein DFR27_0586 [Umboniibacter marinipuniceus]|uniref:Uncharacterized protein n=1 Tax=Umboniibacter marinipuniceus TaxID=569599 RepID=A0A3M0AJ95_9GAMM|nr:hypothetical protein DFR27_0586 [Umboniibacter marinipuniceus]